MAIKLKTQLPNGFEAEYLNVFHFAATPSQRHCQVRLAVYKDEAARRAGLQPASMADPIDLNGEKYPAGNDGISVQAIYQALKTLPGFEAAEDC